MGLSIGVKPGTVIRVSDKPLTIVEISPDSMVVRFEGQTYRLSEFERKEICPQVFVYMGKPKQGLTACPDTFREWDLLPRIVFEAPRHISINRQRPGYGAPQKPRA